ncbi:hypothetical protein SI65_01153 [Aspergillus cristatus]|uniref:Secreted protein n=1 Tax=Aspergillus cristatus TaxID=573508 RepID=A0A1E3BRF4_ASPCR|nr:hypothetical protein SI65_01153 [Aspergillus cristatus]
MITPNIFLFFALFLGIGKKGEGSNTGNVREYVPEELRNALQKSKTDEHKNLQHKNDGQCEEVFAAWTWMLENNADPQSPTKKLSGNKPQPKIVSWEYSDGKKKADAILNPCTTGQADTWACQNLCKELNLSPVSPETTAKTN